MWRINDLFAATPAHPAELISVVALDNLEKSGERGRAAFSKRIIDVLK